MLRDCIRNEDLARQLLYSDTFPEFFRRVEVSNFEIASDAYSTFKDLLTRHKSMVAKYLNENYDEVWEHSVLPSTITSLPPTVFSAVHWALALGQFCYAAAVPQGVGSVLLHHSYTSLAHTQLLGELLLNRANVQIMMRYVADVNNLMLMMNLLKDGSRSIQYEAFHVFKVWKRHSICAQYRTFVGKPRCLLPTLKSPRPSSTSLRSTRRNWSST